MRVARDATTHVGILVEPPQQRVGVVTRPEDRRPGAVGQAPGRDHHTTGDQRLQPLQCAGRSAPTSSAVPEYVLWRTIMRLSLPRRGVPRAANARDLPHATTDRCV